VIVAFFVNQNIAINDNSMTEKDQIEKLTETTIDENKQIDQQAIEQENSTNSETPIKKTPALIEDLTYSSDPVVNAYTIFKNNQLCYSQLENSNSPSIYMQQFLERMDTKQAEYFENYLDYCRQLDKQHPEYSLTNKDVILEQMKKSQPNSLWGKIINNEIEVQDLTQNEIQQLLKSNDINILQEAPNYLETYYQEVIHWDLESFLGNHDYDYVNYIKQYAHQMYLCNLGADCGPNSSIMASLCYLNQSACGLNFPDYFNNTLTQGQQEDIQLALTYLRNQYQ